MVKKPQVRELVRKVQNFPYFQQLYNRNKKLEDTMPPRLNHQSHKQIHLCSFSAKISNAALAIKFPCKLYVRWNNSFDVEMTKTTNPNVTVEDNHAQFEQTIAFQTYMVFDTQSSSYAKKQTSLNIILFSKRKPNEETFVGRVILDLVDIMNNKYVKLSEKKLQFSSIKNASLTFSAVILEKEVTKLNFKDVNPDYFKNIDLNEFQNRNVQIIKEVQANVTEQEEKVEKPANQMNLIDILTDRKLIQPPQIPITSKLISDDGSYTYLISEVEKKRKNMQTENSKLFQMLNQVNEELEKQRIQFSKVKSELNAKITQIQTEKQDIIQELLNQINEEKQKFEQQVSTMKRDMQTSEQQRLESEVQLLQIKFQLSTLREQIVDKDSQIKILNSEVKKEKSSINDSAYNILNQEKKSLEEHIQAIERDRDQLEDEKRELQEKIMSGQLNLVYDFQNRVAAIQSQTQIFRQQMKQNEKQKQVLAKKLKDLEFQHHQLKKRNSESTNLLEKSHKHEKDKDNLLSQKQLELKTLEGYLVGRDKELDILQTKITDLLQDKKKNETALKKSQYEMKKLENLLKNKSKEKQQQESKALIINQQFLQMNKIRTEMTNKNLQLQNQLKSTELKVDKLQKQLKAKQMMIKDRKQLNDNLTKQIEDQIRKAQELEEKLVRFAEKQMKMRQNILILEEQSRKIYEIVLEKQENQETQNMIIQEKETQITNLREKIGEERAKIEIAEKENIDAKRQIYDLKKQILMGKENPNELTTDSTVKYNKMMRMTGERISYLEEMIVKKEQLHQSQIKQLELQIEQMQKSRKNLETDKIKKVQTQKQELKREKDDLFQRYKRLDFNVKQQGNRIIQLQMEAEKHNSKNRANFQKSEEELLRKENQRLKKQVEECEIKLTEQQNLLNENVLKLNQMKTGEQQHININEVGDLVSVCDDLKVLIQNRNKIDKGEEMIQLLIGKNSMLEGKYDQITRERGEIQESARQLSMEFQKIKSVVIKSKGNIEDKKHLIQSLRPCQSIVKNMVNMTQKLTQVNIEDD